MPTVVVPIASATAAALSSATPEAVVTSSSSRRMWTWETNLDDARVHARRERLPLVVYVRADWSAGALEMDRLVWSDPRILFYPLQIVPLRVDVTDGPNAELLAEEFRVRRVPTIIFVNADGREVRRLDGVHSIDDVLSALREIAQENSDR